MNDKLFNELIVASGTLATVVDNAAVVLSEELDQMVRPQIEAVRAILAQCPSPGPVTYFDENGHLFDEHLDIQYLATPQDKSGEARHVKIIHKPTGIGRESYSKATDRENYNVAERALLKAVKARVDEG